MNAVYLVETEFLASNKPEFNTGLNSSDASNFSIEMKERFVWTKPTSSEGYLRSDSLTNEFDLKSERLYLRSLFQMMYSMGAFFGCLLAAIVSNRYGRQKSVWYGTMMLLVLTILSITLPWLEALMVVRFVTGICLTLSLISSISIGMECCTPEKRSVFGIGVGLPYAFVLMIIPGIACLTDNWRTIHLCLSVPVFSVLFCSNPLVYQESPRWLVEKGRVKEAEKIIRRGAEMNRTSYNLPTDLSNCLQIIHKLTNGISHIEIDESPANKMCIVKSLFSSKSMRTLVLVTILNGIIIGVLYVGPPLRTKLSGSPHIYMAVLGILEIPSYTLTIPVTMRYGRRYLSSICFFIFIVLEFILILLIVAHVNNSLTDIALSSVAYTFSACLIMLFQLHISELYPTSVRTLGSGIAYSMICVGYNIPPLMEIIIPAEYFNWLSLLMYCIFAGVGAGLVLLLPETNRKPLLQTVQQYVQYVEEK